MLTCCDGFSVWRESRWGMKRSGNGSLVLRMRKRSFKPRWPLARGACISNAARRVLCSPAPMAPLWKWRLCSLSRSARRAPEMPIPPPRWPRWLPGGMTIGAPNSPPTAGRCIRSSARTARILRRSKRCFKQQAASFVRNAHAIHIVDHWRQDQQNDVANEPAPPPSRHKHHQANQPPSNGGNQEDRPNYMQRKGYAGSEYDEIPSIQEEQHRYN